MPSRRPIVVLGTHDFSEEVDDLVADCPDLEITHFAENLDRERCRAPFLGREVVWIDDMPRLRETHAAVCAIGTVRRHEFCLPVEEMGFRFASVVHPSASLLRSVTVGDGCVVGLGVLVGARTTLGRHVIVNRGSSLGHRTTVGDYVTIAPGCTIAGRVTIGSRVYVGMGSVVLNDLRIGDGAVIGAGSVVTKDVPAGTMVLGYPAAPAQRGIDGL